MKTYLALIQTDVRLAFRQKAVIFFNYLMPLAFLFLFAQAYHAEQGGAILQVFTMVTVIGILGNGLFGAGMRAVQERESNILRRYKVAPISALPLLVASTVTGLIVYIPCVVAMLLISQSRYGMQLPENLGSVLFFIVLGVVAIRSIGLIIAAVVNSMQESTILVQIAYMAMLFLSGATFPASMFPAWLLTVTQFIPATYLVTGMQGILLRHESLASNWQSVGALVLTAVIGLLLSVKLFRWEKEEKMRPAAKLWVVTVLLPFVLLGAWQAYAKDNLRKTRILEREMARSRTVLIRNARIFTGNSAGGVIENGAVLIRYGKIAEVYDSRIPGPKEVNAEAIEAAGKTILPGLIDCHVHLGAPGGLMDDWKDYDGLKISERELAAYLYSGVTAVRSAGDLLDTSLEARRVINSGEKLSAEFFTTGPLFTVPGGHGAEILKSLPAPIRERAGDQFLRMPNTPEEAKQAVDALKGAGVDVIKVVLDAGAGGRVFNRLDPRILRAIAAAAHADGLPVIAHTGDARDVEDALSAGVNGIEHGSFRQRIPDSDFAAMAQNGVSYDPTLSAGEAFRQFAAGNPDLLNRSLVQQVGPAKLLASTRRLIESPEAVARRKSLADYPIDMDVARDNLRRAWRAHVMLITGTDAGNILVIHGPTVQHELELWVDAGIPPQVALEAATVNAAKALRAGERFGSIGKGKDATLLVVDGNPLADIRAAEAISFVMFKGERINRGELLNQE
jgi:imidazolonepropionase-like amidohydrolase/ABC-type multidrug transport system permease subunit